MIKQAEKVARMAEREKQKQLLLEQRAEMGDGDRSQDDS